jgi:hypothetical protein
LRMRGKKWRLKRQEPGTDQARKYYGLVFGYCRLCLDEAQNLWTIGRHFVKFSVAVHLV